MPRSIVLCLPGITGRKAHSAILTHAHPPGGESATGFLGHITGTLGGSGHSGQPFLSLDYTRVSVGIATTEKLIRVFTPTLLLGFSAEIGESALLFQVEDGHVKGPTE